MNEIEEILKKLRAERDDLNRKIEALLLTRGLVQPKRRVKRKTKRTTVNDTLAFAKKHDTITIDKVVERFNISRPAATQRLIVLTNQKQLKRVGAGTYQVIK